MRCESKDCPRRGFGPHEFVPSCAHPARTLGGDACGFVPRGDHWSCPLPAGHAGEHQCSCHPPERADTRKESK